MRPHLRRRSTPPLLERTCRRGRLSVVLGDRCLRSLELRNEAFCSGRLLVCARFGILDAALNVGQLVGELALLLCQCAFESPRSHGKPAATSHGICTKSLIAAARQC